MSAQKASSHAFFLFDDRRKHFMEVRSGMTLGRSGADVQFGADELVSRKHCRFVVDGNHIYLEDLGSTNRTKVNSVAVTPGHRRRIQLYDVIELGKQKLILTNRPERRPASTTDQATRMSRHRGVKGTDGKIRRSSKGTVSRTNLVLSPESFAWVVAREALTKSKYGWWGWASVVLFTTLVASLVYLFTTGRIG